MGGEKRRQKSLRIGVHHANAVVWEPACRTRLRSRSRSSTRRPSLPRVYASDAPATPAPTTMTSHCAWTDHWGEKRRSVGRLNGEEEAGEGFRFDLRTIRTNESIAADNERTNRGGNAGRRDARDRDRDRDRDRGGGRASVDARARTSKPEPPDTVASPPRPMTARAVRSGARSAQRRSNDDDDDARAASIDGRATRTRRDGDDRGRREARGTRTRTRKERRCAVGSRVGVRAGVSRVVRAARRPSMTSADADPTASARPRDQGRSIKSFSPIARFQHLIESHFNRPMNYFCTERTSASRHQRSGRGSGRERRSVPSPLHLRAPRRSACRVISSRDSSSHAPRSRGAPWTRAAPSSPPPVAASPLARARARLVVFARGTRTRSVGTRAMATVSSSSCSLPAHRVGDTFRVKGLELTDHFFACPLDHAAPERASRSKSSRERWSRSTRRVEARPTIPTRAHQRNARRCRTSCTSKAGPGRGRAPDGDRRLARARVRDAPRDPPGPARHGAQHRGLRREPREARRRRDAGGVRVDVSRRRHREGRGGKDTPVPIRPRSRCELHSLRTSPSRVVFLLFSPPTPRDSN